MRKLDERRFEVILDSIADGVFTVETDWKIELFNAAAERITGYKAEEAIGRVCREILRANLCDYDCPIRRAIETGEPVTNCEAIITRKDGSLLPISVSASVIKDEKGRIVGAVETFRDISELKMLEIELLDAFQFAGMVGRSRKMQEVFELIEMLAHNDVTVLIQGETGTGKSLVARAIHFLGPRGKGPFVVVNCPSIPETLFESELFGHVKGAFTGAISDKPGRFELADGGTLFLDEVAEIPTHVQAKLLRAIEDKEFERVGDSRTIKVDVRIIAATNRDLKAEVETRRFREDLYYRLNVVTIRIPPLRERREDIPLLVQFFVEKFNAKFGKKIGGVSEKAMDLLLRYDWPGNVRELENAIEHAFVRCGGDVIGPEHLPDELKGGTYPGGERFDLKLWGDDPLGEAEKTVILKALEKTNWKINEAAKLLKISRATLWRKMKKYGISKQGGRTG